MPSGSPLRFVEFYACFIPEQPMIAVEGGIELSCSLAQELSIAEEEPQAGKIFSLLAYDGRDSGLAAGLRLGEKLAHDGLGGVEVQ